MIYIHIVIGRDPPFQPCNLIHRRNHARKRNRMKKKIITLIWHVWWSDRQKKRAKRNKRLHGQWTIDGKPIQRKEEYNANIQVHAIWGDLVSDGFLKNQIHHLKHTLREIVHVWACVHLTDNDFEFWDFVEKFKKKMSTHIVDCVLSVYCID